MRRRWGFCARRGPKGPPSRPTSRHPVTSLQNASSVAQVFLPCQHGGLGLQKSEPQCAAAYVTANLHYCLAGIPRLNINFDVQAINPELSEAAFLSRQQAPPVATNRLYHYHAPLPCHFIFCVLHVACCFLYGLYIAGLLQVLRFKVGSVYSQARAVLQPGASQRPFFKYQKSQLPSES